MNYLLNVTFFAGSDDPQDVDTGLYLLSVDKEISKQEMENIFSKVNSLLSPFNYSNEAEEFLLSYDCGLNIDTLMEGVEMYLEGKIQKLDAKDGYVFNNCIYKFYFIEQWQ